MHLTGCVNPNDKLKDGCVTLDVDMTLAPGVQSIRGIISGSTIDDNTKIKRLEDCRLKAKKDGYRAWGFRNRSHPQQHMINTCFYYNTYLPPITESTVSGQGEHSMGCANPNETLITGCSPIIDMTVASGVEYKYGVYRDPKFLDDLKQDRSPEDCRAIAKEKNYKLWGHRNGTHSDPKYRNTCFFHPDYLDSITDNPTDKIHMTGCTNPGEKMINGCIPDNNETVATNINVINGHFENTGRVGYRYQGLSQEGCRKMAAENGYKMWQYRGMNHPDKGYKKTCDFLSGLKNAGTIDISKQYDGTHTTGCTDPNKLVRNNCV
jgi:hypothetical protein